MADRTRKEAETAAFIEILLPIVRERHQGAWLDPEDEALQVEIRALYEEYKYRIAARAEEILVSSSKPERIN